MGHGSIIWVPLNARKPVSFASSRYVLYLESTIVFLNIHYSSPKLSPHLRIREALSKRDLNSGSRIGSMPNHGIQCSVDRPDSIQSRHHIGGGHISALKQRHLLLER
jgi:hypothetical protein